MKPITRIFGLDVVRALAIILILCSHTVLLVAPNSESIIAIAIQFFGTIGVDVFFVLSGFLIGGILYKQIEAKQTKFKDFLYFWVRRWFRTLPNYYLVLLINIALAFTLGAFLPEKIWKYVFFLQNFNWSQANFFTESWSLTIEELAYVIGPLLLIIKSLISPLKAKDLLHVSIAVVLFTLLYRFSFHLSAPNESLKWSSHLRKVTLFRLDGIYYGFIASYVYLYANSIWNKNRLKALIAGILLFGFTHLIVLFLGAKPTVTSSFFNVWYLCLLPVSIAFVFPFVMTFKAKGILQKVVTKLSLWSYSIYLVNYSIVLLSIQYFLPVKQLNIVFKALVIIVFWTITVFISGLLYHYFERPIMKLRDSNIIKRFL